MGTKTFDEYHDDTESLDSDDHLYRVTYAYDGKVARITRRDYVDAERAGFCGYMTDTVDVPVSIIKQIAEDLEAGRSPWP